MGPLRIALTWLLLGIAATLAWSCRRGARDPKTTPDGSESKGSSLARKMSDVGRLGQTLPLAIGSVLFICLLVLPAWVETGPSHGILMVSVFFAVLASSQFGTMGTLYLVCAYAGLGFAMYRTLYGSVPILWHLANSMGATLGGWAAYWTGQSLRLGATFAGIDLLVLMAFFYAGWLLRTEGPRWRRALAGAAAILGAHGFYLFILAHTSQIVAWLPPATDPPFPQPYVPPSWDWNHTLRLTFPWNIPALGAFLHLLVACFMIRWSSWKPARHPSPNRAGIPPSQPARDPAWKTVALSIGLALGLAMAASFSFVRSNLDGKLIVANRDGRLDWLRPQHDRYGQPEAGMFGILPSFVESLGGRFEIRSDPTADLADCDVLLLLHVRQPLASTERERLWDYVRGGGTLLVVGDPLNAFGPSIKPSNAILEPTSIRVRHDIAIPASDTWNDAAYTLSHPVTRTEARHAKIHFSDSGSSLQIGWTAQPLFVGQWGWSDPGNDAILIGSSQYEAGEPLGDIVLAAEQAFGRGTVLVLGNGSSLTNEGIVRGYETVGRLLCYLAQRNSRPWAWARRVMTLLFGLGLVAILTWRFDTRHFLGTAGTLALGLIACGIGSRSFTHVVPAGPLNSQSSESATDPASNPNWGLELAYIDTSHLEAASHRDWTFDSINGLALNLMRNGYLTLALPEISKERLEQAAILVSIAPARPYTAGERAILEAFVREGGLLICTTGAEEAAATNPLLAAFDIHIPPSPVPTSGNTQEPEPMGNLSTIYLHAEDYDAGDHKVSVLFHAGWPVEVTGERSEIFVRGRHDLPMVVCRHVGEGHVVAIADTCFAMNKNLEYFGGEPFNGRYDNAHFWRWLLSRLMNNRDWIPPPPPANSMETDTTGQEAEE